MTERSEGTAATELRPPEVVALALVAAAAATGWRGLFAGWGPVAAVGVAGVLATVVSAALTRLLPGRLGVRLAIGGASFVVAVAVAHGGGAPSGPVAVAGVLRDGWARVVTTTLPAPAEGDALGLAVATCWLAGVLAVAAAGRVHRPVLALAAPTAAWVAGLVLGAPGPRPGAVAGLALGAGVGAWLVVRVAGEGDGGTARRPNRLVLGAMTTVVVVALAAVGGPRLTDAAGASRFDPRDLRDDIVVDIDDVNPLAALGGELLGDDDVRFRATVAGGPVPYWRMAVLDRYADGRWTTSARFRRAAGVLPPDADPAGRTSTLTQSIELVAWSSPFLPAADRPTATTVGGLGVDAEAGTLVVAADDAPPTDYEVTSAVPDPTVAEVRGAGPVASGSGGVDGVPPAAADLANEIRAGGGTPFEQLARLEERLRNGDFDYDDVAVPTGHGPRQLQSTVDTRAGTAEQYATLFALAAADLGNDVRLAVGYLPGTTDGDSSVVRAHDAHAWPEVRLSGVGWTAFEPSPLARRGGGRPAPPPPSAAVAEAVEAATPDSPPPPAPAPAPAPEAQTPSAVAGDSGRSVVGPLLVAVAAVVVAAIVLRVAWVPVAARRRRRRRRDAPSPALAVAGAWSEVLDDLDRTGPPVAAGLTAAEVAAGAATRTVAAGPPAATLAALANRVRFAPGDGPDRPPVEAADAERAWVAADAVRQAIRSTMTRPARLGAAVRRPRSRPPAVSSRVGR